VLGRLRVPGSRGLLLFECHLDTVGIDSWGPEALQPRIQAGKLYGRGACDAKGCLTGMLLAMRNLARSPQGLHLDVGLLGSVDEEYRYRGILGYLDQKIPTTAAVIGEPTNLRIVIATKGAVRFSIQTKGVPVHSSRPQDGNNAVYQMVEVIRHLRQTVEPALLGRSHPLVGNPTWSVNIIRGGSATNIVPETCTIVVDRRLIPGETIAGALGEFQRETEKLMQERREIRATVLEPDVTDWPLDTPADAAIVQATQRAAKALGLPTEPAGVPYGSDASKLQMLANVPSIVFGPGDIAQAHTDGEFVLLDQVALSALVYERIAREFRP